MAKNNNNGVENKNKNNDGGEMKEDGPIASKFVKWVKSFQGAESVKSEGQANKLTVVGKVDPTKPRDKLATKTKNKVDVVSPQPKRDNKVNKDDANDTKKKQPEKTDNDEKPKEDPLNLRNLRVLNLTNFRLENLTKLETLNLSGCSSLSKIEGEVINSTNPYDQRNLIALNVQNLRLENLTKLKTLNLAACSSLSKIKGAESVKSEGQANKLTVVGKVDPTMLRDELATKTKNKVDLVSPKPKKDNKVNKDDANDTKKKQPEKTDNVEKPKKDPLNLRNLRVNWRNLRVLNLTNLRLENLRLENFRPQNLTKLETLNLSGCSSLSRIEREVINSTNPYVLRNLIALNVQNLRLENLTDLRFENMPNLKTLNLSACRSLSKIEERYWVSGNDGNNGNDGNGGGGGGGDEKKKEEDEGNGGGKMKYPAGQSRFGQFSYGKGCRHPYGYQNGALETGEKMLLLC